MKKRFVITGMGAVTPIGIGVEQFWEALVAGECGVRPISLFDTTGYPCTIGAEVPDFDSKHFFGHKDARLMARGTQFGVAAALTALDDADWHGKPGDGRLGVATGISTTPQDASEGAYERFQKGGFRTSSPFTVVRCFPHSPASEIGRLTGFQTRVLTVSTACSSGLNAVGCAVDELSAGRCDAVICVGTDSLLSKYVFAYFCRAGMMSQRNNDPRHASRPFDAQRDGGVMGEGAGAFLIEEYEHAQRRGARSYAQILGVGTSGAGYSNGGDSGARGVEGMSQAISRGLADANCAPRHIDYVGCHGCSDVEVDKRETQALKIAFGEHAYRIPMSSAKAQIGIPTSAAGSLQLMAATMAIRKDLLPPTMNYEYPDPACDLDYIPNTPRRNRIRRALVLSHGINGSDTAVVIGRVAQQ
jgi:3-oxoacyl-[acyl-carrier-protein] synthase II